MALGRALETAGVSLVLNKLASKQVVDFFFKWKIDPTLLTKFRTSLNVIHVVLDYAEEKQVDDQDVKAWLDELKIAVHDAEDLLDIIGTAAFQSRNNPDKVREYLFNFFVANDSFKECVDYKVKDAIDVLSPFRERMETRIKEMIERLEYFDKQKEILKLKEGTVGSEYYGRLPTTPFVIKSQVYGRECDKDNMIKLLGVCAKEHEYSSTAGGDVSVVPIAGMGGIGKTTLAQILYDDPEVTKHFNLRAWVCVSDVFDVMRIMKTLVESVTRQTCNISNLELLQDTLKKMLDGKKFLVVLDDIWSEKFDDWEKIRLPFMGGAPGSRIVVTTRSRRVASMMGTTSTYHLGEISDKDCMLLLEQIAFANGNFSNYPQLKALGEQLVQKCKGLPLATKAVGGLLRSNEPTKDHWGAVLQSRIWDSPNSNVLPALWLSYHYLPSHLKQCFSFCSMFPKDHLFEMENMVLLWMGEGYFTDDSDQCFVELVTRSFFQQCSLDKSKFVMHDLIHDLAQFVSGKLCLRLEGKSTLGPHMQANISDKTRHLSYIRGRDEAYPMFEPFCHAKHMRTILPINPPLQFLLSGLSSKVIHDLLPKLRFLRVLSLSGYLIKELPSSMGDLKLLRYLDLSHSAISELPNSISKLYCLQTLILFRCRSLIKLPKDMGCMTELKHLNLEDSDLKEMPLNMGRLTCLQTLSNFIVGSEGSGIKELEYLLNLKGSISISGLHNIINDEHAIQASLGEKKRLDELSLEWKREDDGQRNIDMETNVLDALEPNENLKNLSIKFYHGVEFPNWMGDSYRLPNVVCLHLYGCLNCEALPSLGQLRSLKELIIEGMPRVKHVGEEFYGEYDGSTPFQSLEILEFEKMEEWEEWSSFLDEEIEAFPHLRELSLNRCPKLKRLSHQFVSLEKLKINKCETLIAISVPTSSINLHSREFPLLHRLSLVSCTNMKELPCSLPSLKWLKIDDCVELVKLPKLEKLQKLYLLGPNIKVMKSVVDLGSVTELHLNGLSSLRSLPKEFTKSFSKLEELKISDSGDLLSLSDNQISDSGDRLSLSDNQISDSGDRLSLSDNQISDSGDLFSLSDNQIDFRGFPSLRRLTISGCPQFQALSDEVQILLPALEILDFKLCSNLKSLPLELHNFKTLTELRVDGCPKLESFPENSVPSLLRRLLVKGCGVLTTLPDGMFSSDSIIEHLEIHRCPSLVSFLGSGHIPGTLKHLEIINCKKLVFLPEGLMHGDEMTLKFLEVEGCDSLTSFPSAGELPKTLERLKIVQCANLQSLPPSILLLNQLELLEIACPLLKEFPQGRLRTTSLRLFELNACTNLKTLPDGLHSLKSLVELGIRYCSSLQSLPKQGLPTNLQKLIIHYCEMLSPKPEWKLHKLTSLEMLSISGCRGLASFPNVKLPKSITSLHIHEVPDLESLTEELQHLKSLDKLFISSCENLLSLPEDGLPAMISDLRIRDCPRLMPSCEPDKGAYWPKIAAIPGVYFS